MSDDLRERLARRLLEIYSRYPHQDQDQIRGVIVGFVSEDVRESFLLMADECIRQMEWARQECVESVDSFGAGNSWLVDKVLTLAPEDWNP